jgi:hypothetical protein
MLRELDKGYAFQFQTPSNPTEVMKITRAVEPIDKKLIREVVSGAAFTLFLTGKLYMKDCIGYSVAIL